MPDKNTSEAGNYLSLKKIGTFKAYLLLQVLCYFL